MTTETGTWTLITENLKTKVSSSNIKTWFSNTNLTRLDNNIAVIEVSNKFVAAWLRDNYLDEIKRSFKSILKETPEIQFQYSQKKDAPAIKKDNEGPKNNLNRSMTFDNFIVGEYNKFAFSSAVEVSNGNGIYYNPLFIFSKSGHGKTHLLNAIGNFIVNKDNSLKVKYIHSKNFISDFNHALISKNFNEFKKIYHDLDVFLFDDVDYLKNKKIQDEFLSIFNKLYDDKKQIIITGETQPNKFINLKEQLTSRLGWGLIAEIKEIDQKNKHNIIRYILKNKNITLPNDIIFYLNKSTNNIKILLKNIIRIEAYLSLNNGDINISLIKSLIKDDNNTNLSIKDIQLLTSGYFNISISDIISDKKSSKYSYPRHLSMYLCKKYTGISFKDIGYQFGNRDHSTIIYAIKKIDGLKNKKKSIINDLRNIENLLT
jgi:chromosomal replication initiator protein